MEQEIKYSTATTISLYDIRPIISNPVQRTRALINKSLLAKILLKKSIPNPIKTQLAALGFFTNNINGSIAQGIEHWHKRNWSLSLDYYLWSRLDGFSDHGSTYKDKQASIINQYMQASEAPPSVRAASNKALSLSKKADLPTKSLGEILKRRASVIGLPSRCIAKEILSSILFYGTHGIKYYSPSNVAQDPLIAVSGINTPFEIYLCIYSVESVQTGIYLYDLNTHKIDLLKQYDVIKLRSIMYACQVEQKAANTASFAIMLACNFAKYQWSYRHEHALKKLYVNCGQLMHPLILLATLYDLHTHISPAINDTIALSLLEQDAKQHQVMYILSAG